MMVDILTDTGLDDHVDPDVSGPAADADAKEKVKWKKDDRHALTIIRLRVSPNVTWDSFSHAANSTAHAHPTKCHCRITSNRCASSRESLELSDKRLEMQILLLHYSARYLTSYDSFVQAILSVTAVPDSKTIISSILTEQTCRDKRADESVALTASSRTATHYPKQRYHAPPAPAPTSSAPMASWKNAICNRCNGKGHIARVCPSQPTDEQHNDETHAHPAYDDDSDYESDDYAF
ncbi:hypothetical protein B0H13DRAFT_2303675 [Mycena leptocephala]|nr:hypothetical protein B0H13DRAFT_2303675 [Mycena leptocephala]